MSPEMDNNTTWAARLPRTRGDEPDLLNEIDPAWSSAPHPRG